MISFVIYFHSSRQDNLKQMIRLLIDHEGDWLKHCELILICQDFVDPQPIPLFKRVHLVNLQRETYNKPLMCNRGVREAQLPIIALLDSDRVLPPGYFQRESNLDPGIALAPRHLMSLDQPYEDAEIHTGRFLARGDFRFLENRYRRKNVFSGNTLMFREDYLHSGGMDESFEGYGFADNDMVSTFLATGYQIRLNDSLELHLHHEPMIQMKSNLNQTEFRVYTLRNGIHYYRKWGLPIDPNLWELCREIGLKPLPEECRLIWQECRRQLGFVL